MSTKYWVIKIGGAILANSCALEKFVSTINGLKQSSNLAIVIVHGGGVVVDSMLAQAGLTSEKIDGLRVTPKQHIPMIVGALAGTVNKSLVATANRIGLISAGLALHDGKMTVCDKAATTLGEVGLPQAGDPSIIHALTDAGVTPIISSIGALESGDLVNVNADDAAVVISQLLSAELILLTDVSGVQDGNGKIIAQLDHTSAQRLINSGVISGGMVAKVNAAFRAANHLRRSIAVASWDFPEQIGCLLNGEHTGTRILPETSI